MDSQLILKDEAGTFTVSVFPARDPVRIVLFAVGAGGDPRRHGPLLNVLAEQGLTVVAPHFERLSSGVVHAPELILRRRRIGLAIDYAADIGKPVTGLGHSIGSAMLIGLAGGQMRMHDGKGLDVQVDKRIKRAVVFAPAMDFFMTADALEAIHIPIQLWAGVLDPITPVSQAAILKDTLGSLVDAHFVEGAGHFSFMNQLPPQVADILENRETFLVRLAREVSTFLLAGDVPVQ